MARDELIPRGVQDGRWVATEFGPVWKPGKPKKASPHGNLKRATIMAIRKLATDECRPIIVPQFSGFGSVTRLTELSCAGVPSLTPAHPTWAIDVPPGVHVTGMAPFHMLA